MLSCQLLLLVYKDHVKSLLDVLFPGHSDNLELLQAIHKSDNF